MDIMNKLHHFHHLDFFFTIREVDNAHAMLAPSMQTMQNILCIGNSLRKSLGIKRVRCKYSL